MGTKDISLASAFRYLSGSALAWMYMALLNYRVAKRPIEAIMELTGGSGVTSVAVLTTLSLVTGSLIYFLFRSLIYDVFVMRLLDLYCRWRSRPTYRTWVIDVLKPRNISTSGAQHLASIIEREKLGEDFHTDIIRRAYAGTFLLYLAGILGVITPALFPNWLGLSLSDLGLLHYSKLNAVLVFAIVCWLAGFFLDARQSEQGALALRAETDNWEVFDLAMELGLIDPPSDTDWQDEPSLPTKPTPDDPVNVP